MDKIALESFLLKARTKTYASAGGATEAALSGSKQMEYEEGNWLYRDIYYIGNGIFPGLETIYYEGKPVWSMSYFGDFSKMTEEQTDKMLRKALIDVADKTRIYKEVKKNYDDFEYICNGSGSIDELEGSEEIQVNGERAYFFYYAGGFIG